MPIFDAAPLDTDPEGHQRLTYILNEVSWSLDANSVTASRGSFKLARNPFPINGLTSGVISPAGFAALLDPSGIISVKYAATNAHYSSVTSLRQDLRGSCLVS